MKTMGVYGLARTSFTIIICGMIVLWGISAFGQEWTTEQKEVLKAMEADIEFFKKGDYEVIKLSRLTKNRLCQSTKIGLITTSQLNMSSNPLLCRFLAMWPMCSIHTNLVVLFHLKVAEAWRHS